MSVWPSRGRKKKLGFHWTDFHEILYLRIVRTSVKKIQVLLNTDNNNGYFTWGPIYIYDNISLNLSENEKCIRQNLHRKSRHFIFNIIFPKIVPWKNKVKPYRLHYGNIIRRVRFACWISTAADAKSRACNPDCFSSATVVTRTCYVLHCTYIPSVVNFDRQGVAAVTCIIFEHR